MVSMISMPTPRVLVGLADRANATLPHLPVSTRLGNFLRPPGSPCTLERYRGSWEGSRRRRGGHSSSSLSSSSTTSVAFLRDGARRAGVFFDRKSVVQGKGGSVSVDRGGARQINNKTTK